MVKEAYQIKKNGKDKLKKKCIKKKIQTIKKNVKQIKNILKKISKNQK